MLRLFCAVVLLGFAWRQYGLGSSSAAAYTVSGELEREVGRQAVWWMARGVFALALAAIAGYVAAGGFQ